jgi:hypothetical protein
VLPCRRRHATLGVLLLAACRAPHGDGDPDPPVVAEDDGAQGGGPSERPRLAKDRDAGVDLVYQARGLDGVAVPGRVVVLEPDAAHVHAAEPGAGEIAWRRRLPAEGTGAHTLTADGYRVLLHGGRHLTVLDARDGRILGRNDDVPAHGRHHVEVLGGACAVVGPCAIEVVDCIEAARLGPALGSKGDTCRYAPSVLGRTAEVSLVIAPDGDSARVHAISTGDRRGWSVDVSATPRLQAGVADGLDAVWIVDDARVLVRRASTGEERWRAPLGMLVDRATVHGGLLVIVGRSGRRTTAVAFELDTGRERWRRRLGSRRVVLMAGDDPAPVATGGWRTYEILAPQTGASVGRIAAARDERLWADVDEGYVRTDGDIDELAADGALLRLQPFTGGDVLAIGATHVVSRAGRDLLFHDRILLRERARLERDFAVDTSSAALGPHRVLLRRGDEAGVLFVVVALEPVSRLGAARAADSP